MPQTTILSLVADLPHDRLNQITHDLAGELARADLDAHPADTSVSPGVEVDVGAPGEIALGPFTSSGVTALLGCLDALFEREAGLGAKLRQPDGTVVEIRADNLDEVKRTLAMAMSPPA